MSLYNIKLQFKISQFQTALAFQKIYQVSNFITMCSILPTVADFKQYTATNGVIIKIKEGVQDSITNIESNILILGGATSANMSTCTFGTDLLREEYFLKIVSALKELGVYLDNNGTLPEICKVCINFVNKRNQYCNYILETAPEFDFEVDACSHFMRMHPSILNADIITVK